MTKQQDYDELKALTLALGNEGIEVQERLAGSRQLHRDTLPLKSPWDALVQLGFQRAEAADDMFVYCTFPEGWTKQATDNHYWTSVLDAKGRIRGSYFFKSAFYDRDAFMHLANAVKFGTEPSDGWSSKTYQTDPQIGRVRLEGNVVYETALLLKPADGTKTPEWYNEEQKLADEVRAWVEAHYPDWQNPLAYWHE